MTKKKLRNRKLELNLEKDNDKSNQNFKVTLQKPSRIKKYHVISIYEKL